MATRLGSKMAVSVLTLAITASMVPLSDGLLYFSYQPKINVFSRNSKSCSLHQLTAQTTGVIGPGHALFVAQPNGQLAYLASKRWGTNAQAYVWSRGHQLLVLRSSLSNNYTFKKRDVLYLDMAFDFTTCRLLTDVDAIEERLKQEGGIAAIVNADDVLQQPLSYIGWLDYFTLMKQDYLQ